MVIKRFQGNLHQYISRGLSNQGWNEEMLGQIKSAGKSGVLLGFGLFCFYFVIEVITMS